jgi:pantothenate synthetase
LLVLSAAGVTPDYLALVDEELNDVERVTASTVALVAGKVGTTRLIDNVMLGEGIKDDPSVRRP